MYEIVVIIVTILVTIACLGIFAQVVGVIIQGPDSWVNPFSEEGSLGIMIATIVELPSKFLCYIIRLLYMVGNGIIAGVLGLVNITWEPSEFSCD
jgi:hypothetical protein